MNKRTWIWVILIFWLLICLIAPYIDQIGKSLYYTIRTAVIVGLFAIILAVLFIRQYVQKNKYNKLIIAWKAADYATVIAEGNQLLSKYMDKTLEDTLRIYVATAYLEQGNDSCFWEEINKVQSRALMLNKYFWLTIFYLYKNDETNAAWSEEAMRNVLVSISTEKKSLAKQSAADSVRLAELVKLRQQTTYQFSEEDLQKIKKVRSKLLKKMLRFEGDEALSTSEEKI